MTTREVIRRLRVELAEAEAEVAANERWRWSNGFAMGRQSGFRYALTLIGQTREGMRAEGALERGGEGPMTCAACGRVLRSSGPGNDFRWVKSTLTPDKRPTLALCHWPGQCGNPARRAELLGVGG